jgi:hypothetical protein
MLQTIDGVEFEIGPGADLYRADLFGADLRGTDLYGANLEEADLEEADLEGADLRETNLQNADMEGVNLHNAKLPDFQLPPGDLPGWKKVRNGVVLELLITGNRTATLTSNKCRCDRACVLRATCGSPGPFRSLYSPDFLYAVGEEVACSDYNPDPRTECAPGIHFFRTRREAERYEP